MPKIGTSSPKQQDMQVSRRSRPSPAGRRVNCPLVRLGREDGPGFDDRILLRGKIRRGAGRTSGVALPLRSPFGVGEDGLFEAVGAVEGVVEVPPPSQSRPDRQKEKAGSPGLDAPGTQTS